MPNAPSFKFGVCTVDGAQRQIWVAGSIRPAAPKVFDVLIYLIEHRHRVVTKHELIDCIWEGRSVTDSAVSRAVMKVRRVIDDDCGNPAGIATVHRIGYRFDLHVEVVFSPPDPRHRGAAAVTAAPARKRLTLKPFQSWIDDWRFGWIEFGMPALVCQMLSSDRRLHAQVTPSDANPSPDPPESKGAFDYCCEAGIELEGRAFLLHYRLVGEGFERAGTLRAFELNLLAQELARALVARLFGAAG